MERRKPFAYARQSYNYASTPLLSPLDESEGQVTFRQGTTKPTTESEATLITPFNDKRRSEAFLSLNSTANLHESSILQKSFKPPLAKERKSLFGIPNGLEFGSKAAQRKTMTEMNKKSLLSRQANRSLAKQSSSKLPSELNSKGSRHQSPASPPY